MTYEKFVEDNNLNYQILEMKLNQGKSYREIANSLNRSIATIGQRYRIFSWNLYTCYFRYLNSIGISVDASDIIDFYSATSKAIAYLEKTYSEPLNTFRGDKPPVFLENVKDLIPYRKLTEKQLLNLEKKVVVAREVQRRTFIDIGKELKITGEKARRIYDLYYHKKVLEAIGRIEPNTDTNYIFDFSNNSRIRWELLARDYPNVVQGLIIDSI